MKRKFSQLAPKKLAADLWVTDTKETCRVHLKDGESTIHSTLIFGQCEQLFTMRELPYMSTGLNEIFLLEFTRDTFALFQVLLYSNQMPSEIEWSESAVFLQWCDVYALCDYCHFRQGRNLILSTISSLPELRRPRSLLLLQLLRTIADSHGRYHEIWHCLIELLSAKVRVSPDIPCDEAIGCYDSLNVGEGPRSMRHDFGLCCAHSRGQLGRSKLYGIKLFDVGTADELASLCCSEKASRNQRDILNPTKVTMWCCLHHRPQDVDMRTSIRAHNVVKYQEINNYFMEVGKLPDSVHLSLSRNAISIKNF
jgi:hypothetical protein